MRITYRTLWTLIGLMNKQQLDSDVTVEIFNGEGRECFCAELRICGSNHESLDDGHPVLYCDTTSGEQLEKADIAQIAKDIGLTEDLPVDFSVGKKLYDQAVTFQSTPQSSESVFEKAWRQLLGGLVTPKKSVEDSSEKGDGLV